MKQQGLGPKDRPGTASRSTKTARVVSLGTALSKRPLPTSYRVVSATPTHNSREPLK